MGHNSRARASARPKKRAKLSHNAKVTDTNAEIHVPKTQEQKEEDRREKLRQEVNILMQSSLHFTITYV